MDVTIPGSTAAPTRAATDSAATTDTARADATDADATDTDTTDTAAPTTGKPRRFRVPGFLDRPRRVSFRERIRVAGGVIGFVEQWFCAERRGRYGFATIRIGLGVVLLGYLLINLADAPRVWGPGSIWMGNLRQDSLWGWPFDIAQGAARSTLGFSLWYLATMACALTLVLGWRTRITIPVMYVLFTGLIALNPVVTDNGDLTCRLLLIYLTFADASGVWSLDARRRRLRGLPARPRARRRALIRADLATILHNFVLIAVVVNLCLIYWTAGLLKLQEPLWREGSAVYYPLAIKLYQPWPELSQLVWSSDFGMHVATYGSLVIQLSFPILILSRYTRWVALIAAIGLHVGIAVLMGLAFFSGFMALMDAILISTTAYLWLEGRVLGGKDRLLRWVRREPEPEPAVSGGPEPTGNGRSTTGPATAG